MRLLIQKLAVMAAISGAAASAAAQTTTPAQSLAEPRTVTVTPFVSISFGTSQDLGSSLGIGAAVGYDLTSNLGFEFELGRVFDVAGDDDNLDYKLTTISGNVVYHFAMARFTPYATAGLGWERANPDVESPDSARACGRPVNRDRVELRWRRESACDRPLPGARRHSPLPGQRPGPGSLAAVWRADLLD